MKMSRAEKLVRWCMFSVLIALAPLAASYFSLQVDRREPSLDMLLGSGELLLICATIAAAAIGELIPTGREMPVRKLFAGGSCMAIVVASSLYFAIIQARINPDPASVTTMSVRLFLGMLLAAGCSIYFAHQEGA
jgi:hypothetical protein